MDDDAIFCTACGTKVEEEPPPATDAAQQEPVPEPQPAWQPTPESEAQPVPEAPAAAEPQLAAADGALSDAALPQGIQAEPQPTWQPVEPQAAVAAQPEDAGRAASPRPPQAAGAEPQPAWQPQATEPQPTWQPVEQGGSQAAAEPQPNWQPTPPAPAPATAPASYMPVPAGPPTVPTDLAAPMEPPQLPKKKSMLVPIIVIAAVVVVLVVAGIIGYFAWQESVRSDKYNDASQAMAEGKWDKALDGFLELGDYQDSVSQAALAALYIDYESAKQLLDQGKYQEAKDAFKLVQIAATDGDLLRLLDTGIKKCDYGLADAVLQSGDNYGAYKLFRELGNFEDASARAEACKLPMPATGEIYHNPAFVSTASSMKWDCGNANKPRYFKVYSGDTLVAQVFVVAGGSHEIELPPGAYTIKEAYGDLWWGPDKAFGEEGSYEVMTFDGGSEVYNLGDNIIVTITLSASIDGNVGGRNTNLGSF
jgi:hypothetical protein